MVTVECSHTASLILIIIFCLFSSIDALRPSPKSAPSLPGAYIVEFEEAASSDSTVEDHFYSHLTTLGIKSSRRLSLLHTLFNGVSFNLHSSHDNESTIRMIRSMPIIKQLWPVHLHSLPATVISAPRLPEVPPEIIKGTSVLPDPIDDYVPHVMGGVSKLRNQGYSGNGISIAIVDTGVDYNHPALGAGFGPGFKFSYGYDLVGDAYTGDNTPVPDNDPMDCYGHGTHVSGIIGASQNLFSFTGVVPNATLGMYRVFGCEGSVSNDVLIAAFNMAFEADADLITASIGGGFGWVENAWDIVVSRIVAAGTPCSIAAGNNGTIGAFDSSSAAEAIGATAVGSIDSLTEPALLIGASYKSQNDTAEVGFGYSGGNFDDFGNGQYPLHAITLNTTIPDDACAALPSSTPDLSNYVVLIHRGTCTFDEKIAAVVSFGAKRVMFYNNVPGVSTSPGDTSTTIPVGMVTSDLGTEWISLLSAGIPVTINFTARAQAGIFAEDPMNNLTGGYMSTYSSWGPTYELYVKPEISAPGGYILSTYPIAKGSYAVLSGTSMATPFIAGCIALIKEVRGKKSSPLEIQTLLVTTAKPVDFNDGTNLSYAGILAPVIQQGGGLVDVFTAATMETILSVSTLAFNDTVHLDERSFSLKNDGTDTVTYTLGNIGAATVLSLSSNSSIPSAFPPELQQNPATINFIPEKFTLLPGSEAEIIALLKPPFGLDVTRIPIYSGYVTVNGTNGDYLTLPYSGVAASMYDVKLMDRSDGYPILTNSSDVNGTAISNSSTPCFVLPHHNSSTLSNTTSYPTITWKLAMGSRIVRIDVIAAQNNTSGIQDILGVESLGSIIGYPLPNNPRDVPVQTEWTGQLADWSFVPSGQYSLLLRALKIFGDEKQGEDYESFETAVFEVRYLP